MWEILTERYFNIFSSRIKEWFLYPYFHLKKIKFSNNKSIFNNSAKSSTGIQMTIIIFVCFQVVFPYLQSNVTNKHDAVFILFCFVLKIYLSFSSITFVF